MKVITTTWTWRWLVLQARRRLIRPILLGRHTPEYTARGTAVGLFVSLTPSVGFQIPLVLALWIVIKAGFRRWDFNPVVASAWTLLSNVATLPPLYYLFFITGRLMMGRDAQPPGFDLFRERLESATHNGQDWLEVLWLQVLGLAETFGWPMLIGSLPWAIAGAWLGYHATMRFLRRRNATLSHCTTV